MLHKALSLPVQCIAFRDVNPVSPTHFLVIPRKPIPMLSKAADEDTEVCNRLLYIADLRICFCMWGEWGRVHLDEYMYRCLALNKASCGG